MTWMLLFGQIERPILRFGSPTAPLISKRPDPPGQKGPSPNARALSTGLVALGSGSKPSTRLRKSCKWPVGAYPHRPDEET